MKTFKFILSACIAMAILVSCNKETPKMEEKEKEITVEQLPQVIKDQISANYSGAIMVEADEITHTNGAITYDVLIKLNNKSTELMYDAQGKFLGAEDEDEEEEDDDDGEEDDDRH